MKFKFLIVFACIIGLAACLSKDIRSTILENNLDKPSYEVYKIFHFIFKKDYKIDSEEGESRYETFLKNLEILKAHNSKDNRYKLGLHEFSDMDYSDFPKSQIKNIPSFAEGKKNQNFKISQSDLVDYSNAVPTPPRKWGKCYEAGQLAIATSASYFNYLKTNKKDYYSTQAISDCYLDKRVANENYPKCLDLSAWATKTPMHDKNLPLEKDYPTKNSEEKFKCNSEVVSNANLQNAMKLKQYYHCIDCNYPLWVEMLKTGPVHVSLCWSFDIYLYQSGILRLNEKSCGEWGSFWESVVVQLGYDEAEKTHFVKVQSALGPTWGENGFMRLAVDPNASDKLNGNVFSNGSVVTFE